MQIYVYDENETVGGQPYAILRMTWDEAEQLQEEVKRLAKLTPNRTNHPSDKEGCPVNQAWINIGGDKAILESNLAFRDMIKRAYSRENPGAEVGLRTRLSVRWVDDFQRLVDGGATFGEALSWARARY